MRFGVGEPIGEFEVKSGKLRVTDPCYEDDTWCSGVLTGVKNGTWEAYANIENHGGWGERVAKLVVFHKEHSDDLGMWPQKASFEVGVDSGQAGFFDEDAYPHGERAEDGYWNKDEFYDKCCDATCGRDRDDKADGYGIIDGRGVVSSSGFGDGGYDCNFYKDKDGQIVAAEIVFIPEEDEEEQEEDIPECRECGEQTYDLYDGLCEECGKPECDKCQAQFDESELEDGLCETCREEKA